MTEEEIRVDERRKIAERLRDNACSHYELADVFRRLGADSDARLHTARAEIGEAIAKIVEKEPKTESA